MSDQLENRPWLKPAGEDPAKSGQQLNDRPWLVVAQVNGWMKVAYAEEVEFIARQKAEFLILDPRKTKSDLSDSDLDYIDHVFVYERKAAARVKQSVVWDDG